MTTNDSIIPATAVQPNKLFVFDQPGPSALNLRELVATAQAAGDRAYERVRENGGELPACADAYHQGFATHMWLHGALPPCSCDYCGWLRSEVPSQGGA